MSDEFTETTSESWFGRIGNSITGVLVGIVLVPLSMVLLSWNEGRDIKTVKSLKEGLAAVVSVDPQPVMPANEKKLIHLSGEVLAGKAISDPVFGLTAEALRLERNVEMYQWKENKSSKSEKKFGGSKETVTQYTYEKAWADTHIDSSQFKQREEHGNPARLPVPKNIVTSQNATLGAFKVPERIISRMPGGERLMPTAESLAKLPADWKDKAKLTDDSVYLGADPATPAIGDTRVTFKVLKPAMFTVIAQQRGDSLAPYSTKAGPEIERVESGLISPESMFQHAQDENRLLTWGLRLGGFVLMLIGFSAILSPLSVLADVIPILGDIVGFGTTLIATILAVAGSLIVIAIAWLAVRPLLAAVLIFGGGSALIYGIICVRRNRARVALRSAA